MPQMSMTIQETRVESCSAEATGPHCRVCGALLTHTFVDLGVQPLCQTHIERHRLGEMEPFYPLRVFVCEKDFLVQLPEHVSPRKIFTEYAYFSSYSESWLAHAEQYTEEVVPRFGIRASSFVVEIASNDGYLLQFFAKKRVPVLGIDPASNVAQVAIQKGVPTLIRFFDEELARELASQGRLADLLIGNNVLAQVPDLRGFVLGLKLLLAPRGVITMEFPHLLRLMEGNQFDTIYHEHFSYFSFLVIEKVFAAHGLAIFDVEELPTHGGSLRIYACHAGDTAHPVIGSIDELRNREIETGFNRLSRYLSFGEQVKETKRRLLECLIEIKNQGKSIVGYGAPGKGNTLLNYCGIRSDFLDYTVDRNPYKQGKFTPGTRIPIYHPEKIRETRPDFVLILPWNLQEEIREQLSYVHEWGGKFILPIPAARIIP
jgi:C-methyltransferase-like protein/putative zinc binding protein/methyltransferase family protein